MVFFIRQCKEMGILKIFNFLLEMDHIFKSTSNSLELRIRGSKISNIQKFEI